MNDDYFSRAYKTGSDLWTNIVLPKKGSELLTALPYDAMILDLGAGRGRMLFDLVERGFRVIGVENLPFLVEKGNGEIKNRGFGDKARFIEGDVRKLALADGSFDGVIDIGLLQHLARTDWPLYLAEVTRVLKPGGVLYCILLARETAKYLAWTPRESSTGDFVFENTPFHFFTKEEIELLFKDFFEIKSLHIAQGEMHLDKPVFLTGLLVKK